MPAGSAPVHAPAVALKKHLSFTGLTVELFEDVEEVQSHFPTEAPDTPIEVSALRCEVLSQDMVQSMGIPAWTGADLWSVGIQHEVYISCSYNWGLALISQGRKRHHSHRQLMPGFAVRGAGSLHSGARRLGIQPNPGVQHGQPGTAWVHEPQRQRPNHLIPCHDPAAACFSAGHGRRE